MGAIRSLARFFMPNRDHPERRRPRSCIDIAIRASDELIETMRAARNGPVGMIAADLFKHRNNPHYITTIYEANAEMKSAVDMKRSNGKGTA